MGRYFKPPTHKAVLDAGGRLLKGARFHELVGQLQAGETLAAFNSLPLFDVVYDIGSHDEFMAREALFKDGKIAGLVFYAMPTDLFEDGPPLSALAKE